jgi:hypothetical protein
MVLAKYFASQKESYKEEEVADDYRLLRSQTHLHYFLQVS